MYLHFHLPVFCVLRLVSFLIKEKVLNPQRAVFGSFERCSPQRPLLVHQFVFFVGDIKFTHVHIKISFTDTNTDLHTCYLHYCTHLYLVHCCCHHCEMSVPHWMVPVFQPSGSTRCRHDLCSMISAEKNTETVVQYSSTKTPGNLQKDQAGVTGAADPLVMKSSSDSKPHTVL